MNAVPRLNGAIRAFESGNIAFTAFSPPDIGSAQAVAVLSAIGRFLAIAVTTYLGLLAVTFFIGRVIPIDPVLAVLGDRAPTAVVERTRREMGLDLPLIEQFYIYVKSALSGDFGTSVLTTNPVMADIRRVFPATLELATLGTIIGAVIGVPLGVLAAVKRGSFIDQIVRIIGLIGYSVPKEGAQMWFDQMAIPADAKHVAEAHEFLNYMMTPEVIAKSSNVVLYANGNKASQQFVDKALLSDPSVYPDEETVKKLYTVAPYDPKTQRVITRSWTKIVTGQ